MLCMNTLRNNNFRHLGSFCNTRHTLNQLFMNLILSVRWNGSYQTSVTLSNSIGLDWVLATFRKLDCGPWGYRPKDTRVTSNFKPVSITTEYDGIQTFKSRELCVTLRKLSPKCKETEIEEKIVAGVSKLNSNCTGMVHVIRLITPQCIIL